MAHQVCNLFGVVFFTLCSSFSSWKWDRVGVFSSVSIECLVGYLRVLEFLFGYIGIGNWVMLLFFFSVRSGTGLAVS